MDFFIRTAYASCGTNLWYFFTESLWQKKTKNTYTHTWPTSKSQQDWATLVTRVNKCDRIQTLNFEQYSCIAFMHPRVKSRQATFTESQVALGSSTLCENTFIATSCLFCSPKENTFNFIWCFQSFSFVVRVCVCFEQLWNRENVFRLNSQLCDFRVHSSMKFCESIRF